MSHARDLERENAELRAALQKSCDEDRALHGGCILLVELREDKARMDWLLTFDGSTFADRYRYSHKTLTIAAIDKAMERKSRRKTT